MVILDRKIGDKMEQIKNNKVYEDDLMQDIQEEFEGLFKQGYSINIITEKLIESYKYEIIDDDDAPKFWFALAKIQLRYGVLLPTVKEKAISYISQRMIELEKLKYNGDRIEEIEILLDFNNKLNTSMPNATRNTKSKFYKCEWKIGDVFAYKIESEYAKEKQLYGKYFIIQKVDEHVWHPGHITPIIRVMITKDEKIPKTINELNKLKYIQTRVTKYEDRFLPYDERPIEIQITEKSKIIYKTDEFGYLPGFLLQMITSSRKDLPKKLEFIGNFSSLEPPANEFIPHVKDNITYCKWKAFEQFLINRYYLYNLRQAKIYTVNK